MNLYYLINRYYDPETRRFISQDDVTYLDPEHINGLNLYAYCGNNPVMRIDPDGTFFWFIFFSIIIGMVAGAISGGIDAYNKGENIWAGIFGGALIGGAMGLASALGGMVGVGALSGLNAIIAIGVTATVSYVAGVSSYAITESMNGRTVSFGTAMWHGFITMLEGLSNFAIGAYMGASGLWQAPMGKQFGYMSTIKTFGVLFGTAKYLSNFI